MASDFYLDNPAVKGKPNGPVEAIAGSDIGHRVLNSPFAQGVKNTAKATIAAVATPTAMAIDSVNKGLNIANQAVGGSADYLPTDTTKRLITFGSGNNQTAITPATTVAAAPSAQPAAGLVQRSPLQSAANTTASAAPAIAGGQLPAGVKQFDFNRKQPASGVVANGSRNDFSATSPLAIAGSMVDNRGRTYDEQVAHAKEINANTMQQMQNPTDKQKFDMTFVGKADASNPLYRNAMLTRKVWDDSNKNNQADLTRQNAQTIAGIGADAHNYAADQGLAGHKYTADANVKAHEATAIAGVEKAKIAGMEKAREQGQKDKSAFQQKVYDQTMKSYDFSGMAPTAAHEFATIMARTAGQGYVAVKSPDGKSGDLLVHPELSKLFSPERMAAAQKDPRLFQQLLDMAHKAGGGKGVERLPIKNIDQLKLIKTAEPLPGVPTIAG